MNFRRLLPLAALATSALPAQDISYNRDIRPILSENCFSCHGPDKRARKADRRLDTADGACAEIARFADVDDAVETITHEIDARLVRDIAELDFRVGFLGRGHVKRKHRRAARGLNCEAQAPSKTLPSS